MEAFELFCKESDFIPNIAYSGTRIDNILDFVTNHFGISILMKKSIPTQNYPNLVLCELEHTKISELAFIRKKCPYLILIVQIQKDFFHISRLLLQSILIHLDPLDQSVQM